MTDADPVDALQSLARLVCAMLHSEPPFDRANHRLQRLELRCQKFFAPLPPCLVGMEACATAHYWARELTKLGHEVPLRAHMACIVLRKGVKGSNSCWPSLRTKRMTVCPLMLVQPALGM
jgi:hypothetical protein